MKVNDVYHGFVFQAEKYIPEIDSVGRLFFHQQNGAKLYHLQNDDPNKVFAITFRTPAPNNTGLPHILEHSVLNGSRKFPVKDPFSELEKSSLYTFLNAFTTIDHTVYPVASINNKDFFNLMEVYLDAVFYPRIYKQPEILMQEGWHYDIHPETNEFTYNGVVYNEKKADYSGPDGLLFKEIFKNLYPDTCYGLNSGGDPEEIPHLTQEAFLDYHRTHYHPSNSFLYVYGNGPILDYLRFIHEEYLRNMTAKGPCSTSQIQQPFPRQREVIREYAISEHEQLDQNSLVCLAHTFQATLDPIRTTALKILHQMLLGNSAAPLKRALVEAQIGKEVWSIYMPLLQPCQALIVEGTEADATISVQKVVRNTLQALVSRGIDRSVKYGALNRYEFMLREAQDPHAFMPKGMLYYEAIMESWLHDGPPTALLEYEPIIGHIRNQLDSDYFEQLIQHYLLDNTHATLITLNPRHGLAQEKEKKLKEKLARIKSGLSNTELSKLKADNRKLRRRQNTPDPPELLATLPKLRLSDIQQQALEIPLRNLEEDGARVLFQPTFTNGIAYLNLYCDTTGVPQALLPYISILSMVLGQMTTENYHYTDLIQQLQLHTGGLTSGLENFPFKGNHTNFSPKLVLKTKVFINKLPQLIELIQEITQRTLFEDRTRLREILNSTQIQMKSEILDGYKYELFRALAYFSPKGRYVEQVKGISFYNFLSELIVRFDQQATDILDKLKQVCRLIFHKNNFTFAVTLPEKDYPVLQEPLHDFLSQCREEQISRFEYNLPKLESNEGLATVADVNNVIKGYNFLKLGFSYSGKILVLKTIIELEYLYNKIRVQGGAYSCYTFPGSLWEGDLLFCSGADPHLRQTLASYDSTPEFLRTIAQDYDPTNFIIRTIGQLDHPLQPSQATEKAVFDYFAGITQQDLQQEREQVLATTVQDIRAYADLIRAILNQNCYCVLGNEQKLRQNEDLFGVVQAVFQ